MTNYDASAIQVLEDLEHIRKRPGMYIGSADSDGIRQLLKECSDNGIDEFLAGHATELSVVIDSESQVFTVRDNGRGIPIEKHEKTGESTLITVFTNLQSGGKFGKQAYAVSAGLHGVGLKAVNALSEYVEVVVWRRGKAHTQRFERGEPKGTPKRLKSRDKEVTSGTEVTFHPDPEVFGDSKLPLKPCIQSLVHSAHLCPGLKLEITVDGKTKVLKSSGLPDLVSVRAKAHKASHDPIYFESSDKTTQLALLWTDGEGDNWFSACNASATPEGGKHVDGCMKAIHDVLSPYAKRKKVDARDLVDGLFGAVHVLVSDPLFKSQTKEALANKEVLQRTYDAVYPAVKAFFDKNKKLADSIVARAVEAKKVRDRYKQMRAHMGQVSVKKDKVGVLPDKLVEAEDCPPDQRELFIVEGDSAGGSAKNARLDFQEVLPLRGKIPNGAQKSGAAFFKNAEISAMLTAIGVTIDPKSKKADLSNLRVGRVLLLMDADDDGYHITTLVLTFFALWMPELIEAGKVYIVDSPLFVGQYQDKKWFAHTLKELEALSGKPSSKMLVTRMKGHGESDVEDVRRYAMEPSTRRLYQVSLGENDDQVILKLMGSDSAGRKELLGIEV